MNTDTFDALVIGSGQAGPALAVRLANQGWKTALVERGELGGTCVNNGCTPTKTLVASARAAWVVRHAADYGVADVTTAATFRIASLYREFGKALMTSERPKKLSKIELEQYNVLLEEQAFPFEEKATELHELNARRAAAGIYDQWVQRSFEALRELRPVRYGKNERSEGVVDAIR